MRKIIHLAVIAVLFGSILSCSEKTNKNNLAKLDSLSVQLDIIEKEMNKANIDSIFVVYKMVEQKTNALTMLVKELPEDTATRVNMALHGDVHKFLKKFTKAYSTLSYELKFRKEQLKKLRDDYEAGLFEDSIEFYIKTEEGEINRFKNSFNEKYSFVSKQLEINKEIGDKIDHLLDSLLRSSQLPK